MPRLRRYYSVSELPSQALYLNPERGFFSIIVPIARTNLITNPSVETNTTGYTAVGSLATVDRGTAGAYHGLYGLVASLTNPGPTDGFYYGPISLTAGTTYAASCKFKSPGVGLQYKLSVATTGGVDLVAKRFVATGHWQWIWLYWQETSSTSRRIYLRKDDTRNDPISAFYADGFQCEAINAGEMVSTYIDGDQQGLLPNQFPYPYRWNGTPHASTSTRDATTRAGGYVMNLDRFGFKLLAYTGLGLTLVSNTAYTSASADGSTFQATIANSRQVSIRGRFEATTFPQLQRQRSDLYNVVGPDSVSPRQPLTLIYQAFEGKRETGDPGRIIASYQSGLEQVATPLPAEDTTITFTQYLPAIFTNDSGAALAVQSSVSNANGILRRSPTGVWSALGSGTGTGEVRAIAIGPDGTVYVGGTFASMGGVANTSAIARWNPVTETWSAMSTGMTGGAPQVLAIAVAPNGDVYAGGGFTDAGGSGADNIARWDGSAWNVVGSATAVNSTVNAIAISSTGIVVIGGLFTNVAGIAAADYIAQWDGSAWAAVGGGFPLGSVVSTLAYGQDGTLYIGGSFANVGGDPNADGIAQWDGSAYSGLSTGAALGVNVIAIARNGLVYAGGPFTTIGGVSANRIAVWNGVGWAPIGTGVDNGVFAIAFDPSGALTAGGDFTIAGGVTLPDDIARWNGGAWTAIDVNLPGTPRTWAIATAIDGTLYVGYDTRGTATASGVITATNTGTVLAYPTVKITGPSSGTSRIYQLLNATTGKLIYLNLTINAGEIVTLRTSPSGATLTSSSRGDVLSAILPGSSFGFALVKGSNSISFFAAGSTVTALMSWTNAVQSASNLTW